MKFIETAHIKDVLAYMRIIFNPRDAISWQRALLLLEGIGPRTAAAFMEAISSSDPFDENFSLPAMKRGGESIAELLKELRDMKSQRYSVGEKASAFAEFYKPILKNRHDDWQKRWKDVESFIHIAERYKSLREFLNDMALEPPAESIAELTPESKEVEFLTLSTIHSAKGLEWKAVFLIWALEGRFPSAKAVESIETLEEERRLFYVACTRAKDYLYISYPINIYDRGTGTILSDPSRFIAGIGDEIAERFLLIDDDETEENETDGMEDFDDVGLN
jgi:DNA helicase-2/ATP-dependent DNA helicase PcrA